MSFWDDLFATKKMIMGLSPMDGNRRADAA
jgi:hypothetical protein